MSVPRRIMLGLAVCFVLWLGLTTAAPARQNSCLPPHDVQDANRGSAQAPLPGPADDMSSPKQPESPFGCLMDAVSPEALHEVLHRYFPNRFKDGVYESDHSAMEAVHRADPPLATSLVRIARRQTPGNSTTTTPPPPPPPTTTNTPTTSLSRTTQNPDTTPSLSTSTTTRPRTSNPDAETTPAPTRTTSSTARSQKTQVTTYTSTASNGAVTVVTATTFVPAEPADPTDGTKAGGSLQTNAAVPRPRGVGVEALAGVVIGGMFLV